jgi:hypothetical protein
MERPKAQGVGNVPWTWDQVAGIEWPGAGAWIPFNEPGTLREGVRDRSDEPGTGVRAYTGPPKGV